MNRHTRLHTRKEEDGPTAKAGRKKKGVSASPATQPIELKAAPLPPPASPPKTSSSLPYQFNIPIMPPSFPAYSRPYLGDGSSLPLDNNFLPIPMPVRRFSDVAYGTTLPSLHNQPMSRPRANTLAGLPEALGSFSLVNSPESSGVVDSSEDEDEEEEGNKGLTPSDKDQPESQYPSPAFTSYSPSDLQRDTLSDLEAILANDPLHSNHSSFFHTALASHGEDGFDFESFAASVEGPQPGSTLEDLLNAAASPPTPPSARAAPALLPHEQSQSGLDFDFSATFAAADRQRREREQQKEREQAAAQAAAIAATSSSIPSFSIPSSISFSHPPIASPSQQSPHLSFPSSSPSFPAGAYASAFSTAFPSLMALPNGLGLSENSQPHQALLEAYRKRSAGTSPSAASPAFYIPSSSGESVSPPAIAAAPSMTPAARFSLPVPVWSSAARDGAERGETGALFVV